MLDSVLPPPTCLIRISTPGGSLLQLGHRVGRTMLLGSFCTSHAFQGELRFHPNYQGQSVVTGNPQRCFEGGVAIWVRSWETEVGTLTSDCSGMPIFMICCYRRNEGGSPPGQVEVMNGCRLSQDQPSQTTEELFAHFGCQASLANRACVFLSFFSLSDHLLHSTWSYVASSSLARMGPWVLACGGWALAMLEWSTGSRHVVRRVYLPLHQRWICVCEPQLGD